MSLTSRRQRRLSGLLGLVCLGALTAIYLELDDPISRTARSMPTAAGPAAPPERDHDLAFEMPPLATFAEIAARPLFSPLRRPPDPEAAEPSAGDAPAEAERDFRLRGVATAGASRVALLERRSTGEFLRVLEGQTVDGWRIESIGADTVELLAGDDAYQLELEKDDTPPPPRVERRRRAPDAAEPEAGPDESPEEPAEAPSEDS